MGSKKIKKLVLNKEIISNLTENGMSNVKGGKETETGYGMCICNGTDFCCYTQAGSCPGLNTSNYGCYCA
ncbi:MAG: class I lanthipeptide [Prevotellaceae bacterium]|jgi:hypothetical protein|nr:class I lanthipeptide [Prevotellaceae bacterium]